MQTYDAIVIGSGIGGLACASLLTKLAGKRVLVLERHFKAGGQTHEFERKGPNHRKYAWDVGLHYVGEMEPGQGQRHLLDAITGDSVDWIPLPDPYDVFLYPGFRFDVPFGEARYREGMGRIRDVDVAADGAVMILTDAPDGRLIRLTPAD